MIFEARDGGRGLTLKQHEGSVDGGAKNILSLDCGCDYMDIHWPKLKLNAENELISL